jgi:hypothetical protein
MDDSLSVSDALNLVRDPSTDTQAPERVEHTVWERVARSDLNLFFVEVTLMFCWKGIRAVYHIMFTRLRRICPLTLPRPSLSIPRLYKGPQKRFTREMQFNYG